ncbi:DNA polymerase [Culicoidibacter larvae]|uniref:DNA-directed DNA polymerase n=1 Tax=Culicoidibacter larvae TaxID=2579976 RepID=A0A5R8Q7H3_9FIRM|nr:DNA polymerase [Culicoidibacter larvae]TLG71395.1 hypothetical protein FEZ08_10905 [Culicoidibacter larvae]
MRRELSIDIETYCELDIRKVGAYRYANHESFEILLLAYAYDDEPVSIIDLAKGEILPLFLIHDIQSEDITKGITITAYNANFERTCLSSFFGQKLPPNAWDCTAVWASILGLPNTLGKVGEVLRLEEDQQKLKTGKALINYFCKPCKPTKRNQGRTRNLPEHDPEKWELFKEYCIGDVIAERAIRRKLKNFPMTDTERELWLLDQHINDRGVLIDQQLVSNIVDYNTEHVAVLEAEAIEISGLDNPQSLAQLKGWFLKHEGVEIKSLTKDTIPELLERTDISGNGKRLLEIRQELSKTSVSKYDAMQRAACDDDRIRGILQFYGANRTGRWAGRIVQVHNLPRNSDDIDIARELVVDGDFEMLELLYPSTSRVFSELIRTAIVAPDDKSFVVADFSAIEARVIAWLAGEKWRQDVFASHGKIYEASASQMFKVPLEEVTKDLRQKGKVSELALGYQGGKHALIAMGALDMGIPEEELPELVDAWRKSSPNIVKLWKTVETAAIKAVREHRPVTIQYGITFIYEKGILFIQLPSGRRLAYVKPELKRGNFDKLALCYMGMDQTKKIWTTQWTYGGKLVENIVQAVARDCLGVAMLRIDRSESPIVMHVHDEVVCEVEDQMTDLVLASAYELMSQPIKWAPGLELNADGFVAKFYQK